MNKKNKYLFRITSLILALLCMFNMTFALDEDHTGDVDSGGEDKENGELATNNKWGGVDTGTKVTVVIDTESGPKTVTQELRAGTSIYGTDSIKGYQSSGYAWADKYGEEYNLPEDGILELEREDWAAFLESEGENALAEQVRNGEVKFTGYMEQYILCQIPDENGNRDYYEIPAVEMQAMLDAKNAGQTEFTLSDGTKVNITGIAYIDDFIINSYNAFTEGDQDYEDRQAQNAILGLDENKGYAGYHYTVSGDNDGDGKPDIVTPTPTPTPTVTVTPITGTPTPTPTPTSTPTRTDPVREIVAGYAPEGSSGTPWGRIDNDKFGVEEGNPIPTSRDLKGETCTDIYGKVENLGKYTMIYKPYEYTYKVNWYLKEEYEYEQKETKWNWETHTVEYVYDEDGNIKTRTISGTRIVDSGTLEKTVTLSGQKSFIKILPNTDWFKRTSITLKTANGVYSNTFPLDSGVIYQPTLFTGTDLNRTTLKESDYVYELNDVVRWVEDGYNKNEVKSIAQTNLDNKSKTIDDFWTNPKSDTLLAMGRGVSRNITTNGAVIGSRICAVPVTKTIPESVPNNSTGSTGYPSDGIHGFESLRKGGTSSDYSFEVNSVKVHTPIYNKLTLTPTTKNQLENKGLAGGYPIVTLGGSFTANVQIAVADSYYYNGKGDSFTDLVKEVYIECEVCGKRIPGQTHTCNVPITKSDNKLYKITSTVIAENNGTSGTATANKNQPDNIYILKQETKVYIAGKMYDLEVRATDDPGWKDFKDKVVQKLNKMPVGEAGDNATSAYKYGIKLGYRAYFDLKTLGQATDKIKITPKISYVTKTGIVIPNVDLYYKTSATTYKKLEDNDITITMTMLNTKGDKYNPDFNEEVRNFLAMPTLEAQTADYTKKLNIGGLKGITLDSNNSTLAKYNGRWYGEDSRRWYGEVYLPASTIVAKEGASLTNVARGIDTYKDGYLIITFEPIRAVTSDGANYLKYSTAQSPGGSPNPPYVLIDEKAGKGETTPIKLPNGVTIPKNELTKISSSFYNENAPIIIYDVSLRANNDYESSGTH